MKRTCWNILLVGGLFLTLGVPDAFARGMGGGGGGARGGGGGERGGGERGGSGGAGRGEFGGGSRGMGQGAGGAGREGNSGRGFAGNSSAGGGGYHPGGSGAYGGGNASAAARNPAFSHPGYGQQSGATGGHGAAAGAAYSNRNQPGATGAQGAAAGAAYSNRNQPGATGAQGAAAGAAYANRNNPAFSGAQGAVAGAAYAGYHPSSENYGFYHGTYNGNWGAAYGMGVAAVARPLAWGAGAWGSGASMYNSGYLPYSNPYTSGGGGSGYDYSQPIPVASNAPAAAAPSDPAAGQAPPAANDPEQQLNPAIDAFKSGDYDSALTLVNQALQQSPGDAVMHEFRALVLFAKHNYKDAAATIHSVLAVGPGWDWTTLSSLYSDIENYTKQLQALEAFVEGHPQDGAAHFLLGYHYMTCGHPDTAAGEFEQVIKLVSSDKVAADLLKMLAPPKAGQTQPPEPKSAKPPSKPVDPATLVGTWRAARDDGSKFELALPEDSSFTWKYSQKQKTEEFSGTYSVEGNLLVLARQDGTSLVGQIAADGQKKFNFKILGGPGDDPGLNFGR